jgi:hypothetical protein
MTTRAKIINIGSGAGEVHKQETAKNVHELRTVLAGDGIVVTNNTSDIQIAVGPIEGLQIPVLDDVFTDATVKPFWENTEIFNSGDWQFSAANDRLEGIAENNASDWFRQGIEGNADYMFKFDDNSASSAGLRFVNASTTVRLVYIQSTPGISFEATGKTTITLSITLSDPFWLRLVREADDFRAYYRQNDSDPWTLVGTHSDINIGHIMDAELDGANTAYVLHAIVYDNSFNGTAIKAKAVKVIDLTDATTIAVDASKGNLFAVTLGDNRTLGAPTNAIPGQMILFRIEQDGAGSKTLAYNAIYRFSTDIPSPTLSTAAGAIDYLGFVYHEDDTKWDCIGKVFGF